MTRKAAKKKLPEVVQANIKTIRIAQGMTQKELADKSGLQVQAVSRIENSPQNLSLSNLEKLAAALECSVMDLVDTGEKSGKALRKLAEQNENMRTFIRTMQKLKFGS